MFLLCATFAVPVWADRIDDALALSRQTNRPLLAIGSAEFCGPCRKLHSIIENDHSLQPILKQCVLLEMDSQTQEFRNFVQRFPADASLIPMVYVVLPSGNPMYAKSGGLTVEQLSGLLNQAIAVSTPPARDKSVRLVSSEQDVRGILVDARSNAQNGRLVKALKAVSPIAENLNYGEMSSKAWNYETRLKSVISNWLTELGNQLERGESIHGASYRVAELYVELSDYPMLRQKAGDLLTTYEQNTTTKLAVQQAKFLIEAKHFEGKEDCVNAVKRYSSAVELGDATPAAEFAGRRIVKLRQQQAAKFTAQQ